MTQLWNAHKKALKKSKIEPERSRYTIAATLMERAQSKAVSIPLTAFDS